jgi:carboxyl-terminal processing protease
MHKRTILINIIIILFSFSAVPAHCLSSLDAGFQKTKKEPQGNSVVPGPTVEPKGAPMPEDPHAQYLDFFEEVYRTMEENYYQPVSRARFEEFLKIFDEKIYAQLQETGKSIDYIRWRSAALLVERLRSEEDIFSALYPPKPAKEYEETALGKRSDLGLTGSRSTDGYVLSFIEPRSDAYEKGLHAGDIVKSFDGKQVADLTDAQITEILTPLIDTTVKVSFLDVKKSVVRDADLLSKEYFKQTVFPLPITVPGMYGLKVERFNRATSEDMLRFLEFFRSQSPIKGLILDLRNNPGGPPLSAREISSFFLPAATEFAYFQKKGQEKAVLDVPTIPSRYWYDGPIVIFIDKNSGSAAELFSGILQKRKRAVLMGVNSAGQVMLKSMFNFDDESMLLLITSRGHHPDGSVFSFGGLVPDKRVEGEDDDVLIRSAVAYFVYVYKNGLWDASQRQVHEPPSQP